MSEKKANILWLSHNVPYPPKTGVLQRNYNLLREAGNIGNVYLLAVFQKNILPIEYDMEEVRRELGKFCSHIEIVYLPIDSSKLIWIYTAIESLITRDPFAVNWIKSGRIKSAIKKLLNMTTFDIVHYDTISLAHFLPLTGSIPSILNHHNVESYLMERRASIEKNPLRRFYYGMEAKKLKKYETDHCKKFNLNFTVSELDKETFLKMNPDIKIEVIPNGVDTSYFSRKNAPYKKGNLIFAGGMNWYPNKDAVFLLVKEIWPLLRRKYSEVSLTIVGAHPPAELLELSEKDERLTVTGFVDDVRPYFIDADIYLCPMRDGGGTRLKILDTLSMETALVSTTMGCEGIDTIDNGNVLVADTPEEFVNQVGRILKNPEMRSSLVKSGRTLIEQKYSWNVIGSKLKNIYHYLTKK